VASALASSARAATDAAGRTVAIARRAIALIVAATLAIGGGYRYLAVSALHAAQRLAGDTTRTAAGGAAATSSAVSRAARAGVGGAESIGGAIVSLLRAIVRAVLTAFSAIGATAGEARRRAAATVRGVGHTSSELSGRTARGSSHAVSAAAGALYGLISRAVAGSAMAVRSAVAGTAAAGAGAAGVLGRGGAAAVTFPLTALSATAGAISGVGRSISGRRRDAPTASGTIATPRTASGRTAAERWHDFSRPALTVTGIVASAGAFLAIGFGAISILGSDSNHSVVFGPTFSPSPTAAAASATPVPPPPTPTPNVPQGAVSLALWANVTGAWWFGEMGPDVASYKPGQTIPFMVRLEGVAPGTAYRIDLRYECAGPGAETFNYLSGLQAYGNTPVEAPYGPGRDRPDAAVPVPNTPGLAADDGAAGVLFLYGGTFQRLPDAPAPGGFCPGARTISFDVMASGAVMNLVGSLHLATAAESANGYPSSNAGVPMVVEVVAANQGPVRASLAAGAVTP
jgi:hypothetical protein